MGDFISLWGLLDEYGKVRFRLVPMPLLILFFMEIGVRFFFDDIKAFMVKINSEVLNFNRGGRVTNTKYF